MPSSPRCSICRCSMAGLFGTNIFSSSHTCSICSCTVCTDCAPKFRPHNDSAPLRICKNCDKAGCRVAAPDVHKGKANDREAKASISPNPQDEEEREKRLKAIESRMQNNQLRGKPISGGEAANCTHRTASPVPTQSTHNSPISATTAEATTSPSAPPVNTEVPASAHGTQNTAPPANARSSSDHVVNPILEAALRRQQQQQQRQCNRTHQMSIEKERLLREIDTILNRFKEERPFGLSSSDEKKLTSYLSYIKEKHHLV